MKLCAVIVLCLGFFSKFGEGVSHDYQSTVVIKKQLRREIELT